MNEIAKYLPLVEAIANVALPVIFSVMVPVVVKLSKTKLDKEQQKLLRSSVEVAYWTVEKINRKTETKVDDKVEAGLKELKEALGREPTDHEKASAIRWFNEIHEKKKLGMILGALNPMNKK